MIRELRVRLEAAQSALDDCFQILHRIECTYERTEIRMSPETERQVMKAMQDGHEIGKPFVVKDP